MFIRFFIGPEEQESIRRELRRCRQRRDEMVINFISRMTRIINIAEPNLNEAEKVRDIKLELKDSYQDRLVGHKPSTIEELNDLCQEIEERLEATQRQNLNARPSIGGGRFNQQTAEPPKPSSRRKTKSKQNNAYHCSHCNKNGHTVDRCWTEHGKPDKKKSAAAAVTTEFSDDTEDEAEAEKITEAQPPQITTLRRSACGAVVALTAQRTPASILHTIKLEGRQVQTMVDAGSNLSLIQSDVANELGANVLKSPVRFVSADNQNMNCVGTVELEMEITIRDVTKKGKFNWYVMSKLCVPSLLGLKARGWFRIMSRASNKTIVFEDEMTGVRVLKDTIIPANSEAIVAAVLPSHVPIKSVVITNPFHFKSSILVANTINEVRPDQNIDCLVVNALQAPIVIAPYVFKFNSTLSWKTTDFKHISTRESYELNAALMETVHNVGPIHFKNNEDMVDENAAIEKVAALKQKVEEFRLQGIAIILPMEGGGLSYAVATEGVICSFGALILVIIYLAYNFSSSNNPKHHGMVRTVTDRLHGEGTYDTIRGPSNRVAASPNVVNVNLRELLGGRELA